MRKKYNVLEFDALLEKITEINEVYQVMRLHNLDATIDDAVTFYEQKKREISLEAKIKEPSAVGKCVVTLDTGIDNSVYEVFVNVPYHALIGFLPERYRKHIGKEWNETTHENAVGWSSICESGIGCFFALSGALFGSQLLCWTGIYAVVEGLVRLNTIDNKKYVPSLVTKLPLTLIENIRGPLLKEEKPKLEAYFKQTSPAQVTNVLPSTKPSICKEKGNYIFSNIPHFTRDVEVLADLLDHGVFKTTPDWWNYSLTNKEGIIVPSMMDLFQLLSTAHALKDDDSCGRAAEEFLHRITSHLQHHPRRLNTCTKIIYEGGLKGTIEHLLMNKTTKKMKSLSHNYLLLQMRSILMQTFIS